MMRCLALLVALAQAAPAAAQLAVVVSNPDRSAANADFAAGVVGALGERYALQFPPLRADDVATCDGALACVQEKARAGGASHLLVLGLAGLGGRELAATAKVVAVADGTVLVNESAALIGSAEPRADGRAFAGRFALAAAGLPAPRRAEQELEHGAGPPLDLVGAGLLGAGAVIAATSVIASGVLVEPGARGIVVGVGVGGGAAGALIAAAGAALVTLHGTQTVQEPR